jgi:hypothetical protein
MSHALSHSQIADIHKLGYLVGGAFALAKAALSDRQVQDALGVFVSPFRSAIEFDEEMVEGALRSDDPGELFESIRSFNADVLAYIRDVSPESEVPFFLNAMKKSLSAVAKQKYKIEGELGVSTVGPHDQSYGLIKGELREFRDAYEAAGRNIEKALSGKETFVQVGFGEFRTVDDSKGERRLSAKTVRSSGLKGKQKLSATSSRKRVGAAKKKSYSPRSGRRSGDLVQSGEVIGHVTRSGKIMRSGKTVGYITRSGEVVFYSQGKSMLGRRDFGER